MPLPDVLEAMAQRAPRALLTFVARRRSSGDPLQCAGRHRPGVQGRIRPGHHQQQKDPRGSHGLLPGRAHASVPGPQLPRVRHADPELPAREAGGAVFRRLRSQHERWAIAARARRRREGGSALDAVAVAARRSGPAPHPSCRTRPIASPAAAVRVSTPSFCEHVLQVLVHRARAGAEDVADVAVGLALGHPVQHLGLARGEAEGERHRLDHRGVRASRSTTSHGRRRRSTRAARRSAGVAPRASRSAARGSAARPALPRAATASSGSAAPCCVRRRSTSAQQLRARAASATPAAVGRAHRERGVAEGVERVARLARLARARCTCAAMRASTSRGRIGLVT